MRKRTGRQKKPSKTKTALSWSSIGILSLAVWSETHKVMIMNHHNQREDGGEVQNQCAYCTLVFNNQSKFHQHLKNAHGLLVWNLGRSSNIEVPAQSENRGALEIYEVEYNDHDDVLYFMNLSRYHINERIMSKDSFMPSESSIFSKPYTW